ncbi:MAG TPA: UPF0149 family protein [Woeseiaceae bacterium]|nr:UPF0149 family protein [Woeseiaceae bacterium]
MNADIDYRVLDVALTRCGASWDAAQAHGLVTARLSLEGPAAGPDITRQVLEGTDAADALRGECAALLQDVVASTRHLLAERQSGFAPLLPGDAENAGGRAQALAHWCEGFLHGLVSTERARVPQVAERLAADPVADIISDMLQMTRAVADDGEAEAEEAAWVEIVEYLRVAAQIVYEELADTRPAAAS